MSSGPTDQWEVKPNLWDIDVLKTRNPLAISDISLIFAPCRLNIGGYTMIEIKDTLVIKSDSPKVAEWVKRMKAYKAAQLQDMAKRGGKICELAM